MFPESSNSTQKSEPTQSYPQKTKKLPKSLCNANEDTDEPNLAVNLERSEGPQEC